MPRFGISILKSTAFRDSIQEFSNIYHYAGIGSMPNAAQANALIDELTANEKVFHSSAVSFVRGMLWKADGTKAENVMISQKLLSGEGSTPTTPGFDRERAFLVQWPAGTNSRGKPVRLKKWYHSCGQFGGFQITNGHMSNVSGFSSAERAEIANTADSVTRIGTTDEWGLVAPSGRERNGGAPIAHRYLEHHQLGDQWRQ
jgi:hypothetical protein